MVYLFREVFFLISFTTVVKLITGAPMERTKLTEEFVNYVKSRGFLPDDVGLHMRISKRRSWGQKPTHIIRRGREEGKDGLRKLQLSSLVEMVQRTDKGTMPTEQKRCGTRNIHTIGRSKRYTLELRGRTWGSKDLSYTIENFPLYMTREVVENTIVKALQMWSNATQLSFTRGNATDAYANINFKFVTGYHGDGHPTDGPGRELAHAFSPFNNLGLSGDVHFDADETFTIYGGDGVDLLWVALHEVGHSLGLSHTYQPNSVMFPVYKGYTRKLQLSSDDRDGIQHLYGPPRILTATKLITSPSPPASYKTLPHVCLIKKIDAAVRTSDGSGYVFSGAYFWRLRKSGVNKALRIRDYWVGLEDEIDAALTRRQNGLFKTYFFKGSKYWIFNNTAPFEGPLNITELNLPSELSHMDAALDRPGTNYSYFFKGDRYWRYNWSNGSVDQGFPQMIAVSWKRMPKNMDAAFQWRKRRVFIIKGSHYFALKHQWNRGVKKEFPKQIFKHWFGCPN